MYVKSYNMVSRGGDDRLRKIVNIFTTYDESHE